jgi:hypothetical protein
MHDDIYDFVILGGGVAGLNAAYQLLKHNRNVRLVVVEKEKILGGRIHSYHDKYMSVESGAGRIHTGQVRVNALIRELGLEGELVPIDGGVEDYYDVREGGGDDGDGDDVTGGRRRPLRNPNGEIIRVLLEKSRQTKTSHLLKMSLLEFAGEVLEPAKVQRLCDSFGYYTELVKMNAKDAIELITGHLSPDHEYMILRGGLSQIIDNLRDRIVEMGGEIKLNCRCLAIEGGGGGYEISCKLGGGRIDIFRGDVAAEGGARKTQKKHRQSGRGHNSSSRGGRSIMLSAKKIVCALPKQVLETIRFFRPIWPELRFIVCEPLCRIYSKFPVGDDGNVWFHKLSKFTTNNPLRMVIPINSADGVIMSSYTDYDFARGWKKLYDKRGGVDSVNRELVKLLEESTGISPIPMPIKTRVFYWPCGVGYWGIGADSAKIAKKLARPVAKNVYVCGEHFSEKNQQWIEGALETFSDLGLV